MGYFFYKTISNKVCITCHFIFESRSPLHPHNSVHFKFCFLERQRFMQLVLQLHLLSSLQAWDTSVNVVQIGSIPFLLSSHPHSLMLTLSRRRPLSYRNQSIYLLRKSMDWFLYDNGHRIERVNLLRPFFVGITSYTAKHE